MTCFLFNHALDLHERFQARPGENTGRKYALAARNARKALEIIDKFCDINSLSKFNLLSEGERGHNTGRKGHFRDKTRSFRTKGDYRDN